MGRADLALFCEEMVEKLRQIESYIQQLREDNERLEGELNILRDEVGILQQRFEIFGEWETAGRQALPTVPSLEENEMPVILLRWDRNEEEAEL